MLNDLKEIVAINSVEGEPAKNAPFGAGPRQALDWFLNKAVSYGLETGEVGGYCGWAEYGEGRLVGVLAHLDIVPADGGWTTDPFTLSVRGGNIYGRGVMDDKGGAVAALWALKSIKDDNIKLGGRVRVIVGCNEESGCGCMKYYAKHCELPEVSFTPDADFPVINSEKGIAHLRIRFAPEAELSNSFEYIRGGKRPNVVPAHAECKITGALAARLSEKQDRIAKRLAADSVNADDISYQTTSDGVIVTAKGRAAHGSTPEKGDNALRKLFSVLAGLIDSPAIGFVADYLAPKDADHRLHIAAEDSRSGRLTLNLGAAELTPDGLTATVDVRRPLSLEFETLVSRISEALPAGAVIETLANEKNLYIEKDSPLVKTLLSVYEKHFGQKGSPLQIGGGTYAKTLPNCVAFGPALGGVDYHIHDADEFIPEKLFYKLADIYRDAMIALCGGTLS